jgi:hypothetical protein
MAYNLLASESTVHVLSPTEVVDAVRATVNTPTHNIIAASIVPESIWGTTAGIDQLNQYAFGVEYIIDHTAAISAVGTQSIDANGLLQHNVTFTVGYTPAGATTGPLTVQVDVPNALLEQIIAPNGPHPGLDQAIAIVNGAAASLQAMSGG